MAEDMEKSEEPALTQIGEGREKTDYSASTQMQGCGGGRVREAAQLTQPRPSCATNSWWFVPLSFSMGYSTCARLDLPPSRLNLRKRFLAACPEICDDTPMSRNTMWGFFP